MVYSASYCFTLNNYTDIDESKLKDLYEVKKFKYMVYGYEEAPTTGTKHLQGFFITSKSIEFKTCLAWFKKDDNLRRIHLEACKGTNEENYNYCTKDKQFKEYGVFVQGKGSQERTKAKLAEQVQECKTYAEVLNLPQAKRFLAYCKELWNLKQVEQHKSEAFEYCKDFTYNEYQQKFLECIKSQENDRRTVNIVIDVKGNSGKSTFVDLLRRDGYEVFYMTGGKCRDIAHIYNYEPIIIYDVARCNDDEAINWQIVEMFKNGKLTSPKYEGCTKYFKSPVVFIMTNKDEQHLSLHKYLSQDRINIIEISTNDD